jgi:threonine dehydratase
MGSIEQLQAPTIDDILAARERIRPHLPANVALHLPDPERAHRRRRLGQAREPPPGRRVKVRGGINLISRLTEDERRRGVIAASTGNHGQSVAFAAQRFCVKAIVCVPKNAKPGQGRLDARARRGDRRTRTRLRRRPRARRADADADGYRYIHSGNKPHLIAGVATSTLEILEDLPDAEALIVPVGGGSGAAGACIVAAARAPSLRVVGVQSVQAPAAYRSWREGHAVEDRMGTYAEGLATRTAFELPQRIMRERLADFLLVDDDDIRRAQVAMIERTRNLVEAAGAAALAAVLTRPEEFRGTRVIVVCSGGNVSPAQLLDLLSTAPRPPAAS